ncbi:ENDOGLUCANASE 2 [Salix koriyanagi]|uniref:cellulase n=1 Tax=Salix koriyanagi TaxID=2511006 RepID=A0A9Q0SM68_9ROSI|nr:ENDOGLUCANASE 2 [Salix koriyanagi]
MAAGKLVNNRIAWRGDSGLLDGIEMNLDLSKGMYDAGDLMKFGFPLAFPAKMLSWAIPGSLLAPNFEDGVKEMGDPELDHQCWERPEAIRGIRPLTQANTSSPGTEVAAETAAMASASLVFKKIDSSYSNLLHEHAQQLFSFADAYRGSYSVSIPQVQNYYNSTGYEDELFWDDKHARTQQVLLSRANLFGAKGMSSEENLDLQMYRKTSEAIMCELLPNSPTATTSRTNGGLVWVSKWNCLQHAMTSAFLVVLFSDYMVTAQISTLYCHGQLYSPADLRDFGISQADYILRNNPMKMSFLVRHGRD